MTEHSQHHPLILVDTAEWRDWLARNDRASDGVWLLLAKKNVTTPTSLSYQEALEEALCSGWIDGQRRKFDDTTFVQRFTPRRSRSNWSKRNVEIVQRLSDDRRMRERGAAEVAAAKADGRWANAYLGQAQVTIPDDLRDALARAPEAHAAFDRFTRAERYSAMLPILTARSDETRARIIARLVDRLGEVDQRQG